MVSGFRYQKSNRRRSRRIVGSGTRKAINDCNLEKDRVKAYRIKYYCDLVNKKPEQERFFYGWVRRSLEV
jgi:hypothetical protein